MLSWLLQMAVSGVCPLCGEKDSTEHVFSCENRGRGYGVCVKDLDDGQKMDKIVNLFKNTETFRREKILENIETNFDVNVNSGSES